MLKRVLQGKQSDSTPVLVSVREFNGAYCREHVARLVRLYPEFKSSGTKILGILGNLWSKPTGL